MVRREPRGRVRRWHANPFWVRPRLREDAHVEKYLTLEGDGREIELGAFLSPWERERSTARSRRAAPARLRSRPRPALSLDGPAVARTGRMARRAGVAREHNP